NCAVRRSNGWRGFLVGNDKYHGAKLLPVLTGEYETMPPMWLMRQVRRNLPEYHAVREKAVSLRVAAWSAVAFIASVTVSYAGPCTDDIGRMQGRIDDKLEAKAAAGPYAVESSRAQRSDQPTPRSMAATEERLGEISPNG